MGDQIDEVLNSMSPRELKALEVEIDKQAQESEVAYYRSLGIKAARDAWGQYATTGELTPELTLVKAAGGLKDLSPEDRAKFTANKKNPPGPAGGPGVAVKKESEEDIVALLDKCSAEQLQEIEAEVDAKLAEIRTYEYAKGYHEIGRKLAQAYAAGMGKEAAPKGLPFLEALSKGLSGEAVRGAAKKQVGYRTGQWMKKHPLASAGVGAGAGFLGSRILER